MSYNNKITLYTWKHDRYDTQKIHPLITLKSMCKRHEVIYTEQDDYNPIENAKNLVKLFTNSLPSNTLDEFYEMIAEYLIAHPTDSKKELITNIRLSIQSMEDN